MNKKIIISEIKNIKSRFSNNRNILSYKELIMRYDNNKNIKNIFENMWLGNPEYLNKEGLKIELRGRIRGALKKRKLVRNKEGGSIKSQSINWNIEFIKKEIYTKWGILGLRIHRLVK